jgi:tetratricopeptide (TPR) repeat protein
VRAARRKRGLTQAQVAGEVMAPSYLSLIESGQRDPSPDVLAHLARILDLDEQELATGRPAGLQAELELRLQQARIDLHQGRRDVATETARFVGEEAQAADLSRLHARALTVLAGCLRESGDIDAARELLEQSLQVWSQHPPHLRFETVANHAIMLLYFGEARFAAHLLETYLLELDEAGLPDPLARMRTYSALVACYRELGMRRESNAAAESALRLAPRVEDAEQIACMSRNVSVSLLDQGRHEDALEVLRRAEDVYQELDWSRSIASTRWNRGMVAGAKGDFDQARACFEEALAELERAGTAAGERAGLINELARVERFAGNTERAIELLRQVRPDIPVDESGSRAMNHHELGLCLIASDLGAAESELTQAAELYELAGNRRDKAQALLDLGNLYREQGKSDEAAAALEAGLRASLEADQLP